MAIIYPFITFRLGTLYPSGVSRESALVAEIREMLSKSRALGRDLKFEPTLKIMTVNDADDIVIQR